MAYFGSIGEFRAALDNLVNNTGHQNPSRDPGHVRSALKVRKPRKKGRARQNMAVRVPFQGEMIEFTGPNAPQEAAAFLREMGGDPRGSSPSVEAHRVAERAVQRVERSAPSGQDPDLGDVLHPDQTWIVASRRRRPAVVHQQRPPSRSLLGDVPEDWKFKAPYGAASLLLGGQKTYCPGLRAQVKRGQTLSNQKALRHMGLEPDQLFSFLDAVSTAHPEAFTTAHRKDGTPYPSVVREQINAQVVASATDILNTQFGVTCPVPGPGAGGFASQNPYGRW